MALPGRPRRRASRAAATAAFADPQAVDDTFDEREAADLAVYGYGVKGFTLCAVETAAHLAGSVLTAEVVHQVLGWVRDMLTAPVELLPGAAAAVTALRAAGHRLVLVTKGDLIDQERKLAASGLADNCDHVEVLSDKTSPKYTELLRLLDRPPGVFLMVGNSAASLRRRPTTGQGGPVGTTGAVGYAHASCPSCLPCLACTDLTFQPVEAFG